MRISSGITIVRDSYPHRHLPYLTLEESQQQVIDEIMDRGRKYLAEGNLMYAVGAFYKAHRKQERLDAQQFASVWPPQVIQWNVDQITRAENARILDALLNGKPL